MAIDPTTLARLAQAYTQGMTSIRGRRVQRLLLFEFSGADEVRCVQLDTGDNAVLGVSRDGAALCATKGRGPAVAVVKWLHGATKGLETRFSLLKDSLPEMSSATVDLSPFSPYPKRSGAGGSAAGGGRIVRLSARGARGGSGSGEASSSPS